MTEAFTLICTFVHFVVQDDGRDNLLLVLCEQQA